MKFKNLEHITSINCIWYGWSITAYANRGNCFEWLF